MSQDKSDRMSGDLFARRSERMCQREWSKMSGMSEDIAMSERSSKRMFG